ncbi:MAG: acetylglutamate kinase [Candidatus Tectomicrobia bacterium]|uniref:Acetylglutamate kinase n=1 Tax=Tectimicrobiota bacterium TaxID=2528274 RepID=A0A933GPY6_UNCTE|nr:acetylglutamate kinase [Candidatus Tectomicrobia bacterium]
MEKLIEKAQVLLEALPYIKKFYGKTFVIKFGGNAMIDQQYKEDFALDMVLMKFIGLNPVIVHGGGPQIGSLLKKVGKESKFIQGLRVTDSETMEIVEMVLGGSINKEIVALINRHGGKAVGITGKDGGLIQASKMSLTTSSSDGKHVELVDLGLVGDITKVNPNLIKSLEESGFIAVIAPIGFGTKGEAYNINADSVAGHVAAALRAEKLIMLSDIPGLMDKEGQLISSVNLEAVKQLIEEGTIKGGMLPKVEACKIALENGVPKTHIIDGRVSHAALLEIFTEKGIGTEIVI